MEPDFDVKQELRFVGGVLDLRQFDKVFISISGGKDSHAMTFLVKEIAEKQGCTDRLVAMYADTGMEWHNAESHVRRICEAAKIPLEVVYPVRPMLEQMKYRGKRLVEMERKRYDGKSNTGVLFPSPHCRYCTANQKIDPMDKLVRKYSGKLLKVTGERWQESKARSTYSEFVKVDRISTQKSVTMGGGRSYRVVYGWRPMLAFSTEDIFSMVKDSGVERHMAYDAGCDRLGCAGCIFSNDRELKIEMENNPHILAGLDELERKSGFSMSMDGRTVMERIKKA
jgi:3'-phosphoadenosine 5'-phosphosulfate sulfotransferase (PAPS reductase)/FAD synthetase